MRKLILALLVLAVLPSTTALDLYHNATMSYDNGEVTLISNSIVSLEDYDFEYYRTPNDYTALMVDGKSVLGIYYFDFNLWLHVVGVSDGQIINTQEVIKKQNTISAYFPYTKDATAIIIKGPELNDILTIELKAPETEEKITEEQIEKKKELPINYILTALIAFLLIVILWMLLRKKKE